MTRVAVVSVALLVAAGLGAVVIGGDSVRPRSAHVTAPAAAPPADDPDRAEVLDVPFEHFDGRVVRLGAWQDRPLVVNFGPRGARRASPR